MAYKVGDIDVILKQAPPLDSPGAIYYGLSPSTTTLPRGFQRDPSCREFPVDTIWERDIEVPMRDGIKLRADAFRPAGTEEKVPVVMAFSPYGKSGTGILFLDIVQVRMGIPKERLSGFESWEAFDPAEWVSYGYAVVNVDSRGIFDSEGIHRWHGTAEGQDGYDTVEYFGQLPWCNGHVAFMGNSWLASCQWFIAAERPPHLSCMLPLEGLSDVYRESLCRGGVPYTPFWGFLRNTLFSRNKQEDTIKMIEKYPLMNEYWQDKRAKAHLINVPAYVLASMSTGLHTVGSIRCFEDIPHDKKWLRLHPTQEWHDLYQNDSVQDFKKFLDFYTKGIQNGWEQTPRVRLSVLRYNQAPIINVPFSAWPIPERKKIQLFLCSDNSLGFETPSSPGEVSYQADTISQQIDEGGEEAVFTHRFDEPATLVGASRAVLWMSCLEHDDLDVFVQIRKADKNGKVLRWVNIPLDQSGIKHEDDVEITNPSIYLGPTGVLRASHRAIDPELSKPEWPAHDHTRLDKVPTGKVVRLEIGLWPAAMHFEKDEQLILKVAGHPMTLAEFTSLRGQCVTGNVGRHVVHFGQQYDSRIEIQTVQLPEGIKTTW